jgi:head-tail adaptor
MAMLDPGKMRDRITLQRQSAPSGGRLNAPRKTGWVDFLTNIRAEVEDVLPSKAETMSGVINVERRPAKIRMWRRDGITSDMRILVLSPEDMVTRTMTIVAGPAFIGERREGIELMAEEVTSAADVA